MVTLWRRLFGRNKRTEKFSRWYVSQCAVNGRWRVMDDSYAAVCTTRSKVEADDIVAQHNRLDPIKSYEDWLFYKC